MTTPGIAEFGADCVMSGFAWSTYPLIDFRLVRVSVPALCNLGFWSAAEPSLL